MRRIKIIIFNFKRCSGEYKFYYKLPKCTPCMITAKSWPLCRLIIYMESLTHGCSSWYTYHFPSTPLLMWINDIFSKFCHFPFCFVSLQILRVY
jgi:hypothetical protein